MYRFLILALLPMAAQADPAQIVGAVARMQGGAWTVSVTIRHADTGWEDYADAWRVELANGTVLATRDLEHPHVTEQPFTRSQTGIAVPGGTKSLKVRARTLPTGWDSRTYTLTLP